MPSIKKIWMVILLATLVMVLVIIVGRNFFTKEKEAGTEKIDTSSSAPSSDSNFSGSVSQEKADQIKKQFGDFTQRASREKTDSGLIRISVEENEIIPLGSFAKTMNLEINPKLKNLLDYNNYGVFFCSEKDSRKSFGLVLNMKLFRGTYSEDLYKDAKSYMREWEANIFRDTHTIIFPDAEFSKKELEQKLTFKDGTYRYADIVIPGGKTASINYNIVFDSIIIATSLDCMDKMTEAFETPEP